jgi:hypothetical protein
MNGYRWIPYVYLTIPDLASDFWAIHTLATNSLPASSLTPDYLG